MKNFRYSLIPVLLALIVFSTPSFAVSKEIVQLQTQVQALQDAMRQMQQSFDERMGIMRNLVEGSTDKMNQINVSLQELQKALNQQHTDSGARADQISGQIQSLNDAVDELKARMTKITTTLEAIQAAQTNLPAGAPPGGQPGQPAAQQQAPPPDVLYNNALRDYNAGKYDLASQEFADYMKFYANTDLAGNAQFYLAELEYRQGNFEAAARDYDKVLEQYPGGNKVPAAQLKKGMALQQLGRKAEAVREFQSLIQRYPRSLEADQARKQLRTLGVGTTPARPSAGRRRF